VRCRILTCPSGSAAQADSRIFSGSQPQTTLLMCMSESPENRGGAVMAFRSRMTLVVLGIATTLLIAVILAIPAPFDLGSLSAKGDFLPSGKNWERS
jgi:hypothetical protein